jgi:hypothetical protein
MGATACKATRGGAGGPARDLVRARVDGSSEAARIGLGSPAAGLARRPDLANLHLSSSARACVGSASSDGSRIQM